MGLGGSLWCCLWTWQVLIYLEMVRGCESSTERLCFSELSLLPAGSGLGTVIAEQSPQSMFVFGLDVSYFPVGVDGSECAGGSDGSGATVNGFSISDGQTAGQWDSPVRKCFLCCSSHPSCFLFLYIDSSYLRPSRY